MSRKDKGIKGVMVTKSEGQEDEPLGAFIRGETVSGGASLKWPNQFEI